MNSRVLYSSRFLKSLYYIILLLLFHQKNWAVLCSSGKDDYEMLKAAEYGDAATCLRLIKEEGVPLVTKNNYGVSAIIFAANNGHFKLVEELLKIGADIEDRSNNGRTPLLWASVWGHFDVCSLLINHGANMSVSDAEGMTPVMWATRNGHVKVLKFLIKRGAPITLMNKYNGTALSIARIKGKGELIDILEEHFPIEIEQSPFQVLFEIIANKTYDHFDSAMNELIFQFSAVVKTIKESSIYNEHVHPHVQSVATAFQRWWVEVVTEMCSLPVVSSVNGLGNVCEYLLKSGACYDEYDGMFAKVAMTRGSTSQ